MDEVKHDLPSLKRSVSRILDRLEVSAASRGRALDSTVTAAMSHCANDPQVEEFETWEAWVTAMQVGSALFDSATASQDVVACRIGVDGQIKNLPATGPTPYTHAGAWLTTVYLATICRDNARLDRLMRVPTSFLRESGAVFDDYVYDWVETLQRYWSGESTEMWNHLVEAIQETAPEVARFADQELLLKVLYPPLELFQLYNRQANEEFNESLSLSLEWHREYWTGDQARPIDRKGLVTLGPLAISCMAYDNDFSIDVESDYLPEGLLKFSWAGEVET
ncbi:immunity 49 family protein [Streptomyces cavernicola]|uniref:Immunity 49 family protein n=1 Tax=Streptomyces cavernicola TaxID=3043613 RepID=A0ABT6S2K4_9ACTN|nr:immunity 49 family protein [Streptomyces sp. B-S-A6]MDI3402316.1 immunity 49 family protein [Streptomyces sp. B-S-A6]